MVSKYHGFTTLGLNEMKSIHLKRLVVKPINLAWRISKRHDDIL